MSMIRAPSRLKVVGWDQRNCLTIPRWVAWDVHILHDHVKRLNLYGRRRIVHEELQLEHGANSGPLRKRLRPRAAAETQAAARAANVWKVRTSNCCGAADYTHRKKHLHVLVPNGGTGRYPVGGLLLFPPPSYIFFIPKCWVLVLVFVHSR